MRNEISLFKRYPAPENLSRLPSAGSTGRRRATGSAALALSLLLAGAALPAWSPSRPTAPATQPASPAPGPALALPGRPAPDIAAVFLPRQLPAGSYLVTELDAPLPEARAEVMARLAPSARVEDPSGPWSIGQGDPLAAFGDAPRFDRPTLARLYAGKPVSIVRAPIRRDGRVVGALTLLSPYPDARLTRLSRGTLAILLVVDTAREGARK